MTIDFYGGEIEMIQQIVGLHLADCRRQVYFQSFEFGEQRAQTNRKGREIWLSPYSLDTMMADWVFTGPDEFRFSSADYELDRAVGVALEVRYLSERWRKNPPVVTSVTVTPSGAVSISMTDGYQLDVTPDYCLRRFRNESDQWAFVGRGSDSVWCHTKRPNPDADPEPPGGDVWVRSEVATKEGRSAGIPMLSGGYMESRCAECNWTSDT